MREKGFTLFELLLVITISIIIGSIMMAIMVNQAGVFNQQNSLVSQGVSLNNAMSLIADDIRSSSRVVLGYPAVNPTYTSSSTVLVLQLHALDGNGNNLAEVYDYIVYTRDQNNKILRRKIFPDVTSSRKSLDQVVTTLLNTIDFSYFDDNGQLTTPVNAARVSATLSVIGRAGSKNASQSASINAILRNTP